MKAQATVDMPALTNSQYMYVTNTHRLQDGQFLTSTKHDITKMYQDGHRRAKNQSNWSNASTVQVQKVRGQTYSVPPPDFQVGGQAPRPPVPTPL